MHKISKMLAVVAVAGALAMGSAHAFWGGGPWGGSPWGGGPGYGGWGAPYGPPPAPAAPAPAESK